MAQRTRRLITHINQENDDHAAQTAKLPGKTAALPSERVLLSRRPALKDVGNKDVTNKNAAPSKTATAAGAAAGVKKSIVLIDKPRLVTKTVKTTTATIVKKEETTASTTAIAAKKPAVLNRQESILTRHSASNSVQVVPAENAYSSKRFSIVADPDANDGSNLMLVSEYVKEILEYLRALEKQYAIRKDFLSAHKSTSRMRSVLVNWLVEVHSNFSLLQETLHLTVAIVDRYLAITPSVSRNNLQLVGIAGLLVACKYEEMYFPEISDFLYVCDNTFTHAELLQMERDLLRSLGFNLGRPLSLHFLRRYNKVIKASQVLHNFGKYLLEICLLEYELCHFDPSLQAAAAVYLATTVLGSSAAAGPSAVAFGKNMFHFVTGYEYKDVKAVVCLLANAVLKMEQTKYTQIRQKYCCAKYSKVSTRPELKGLALKKLTQLV